MTTFISILFDQFLMEGFSEIFQVPSAFFNQRIVPSLRDWISPIEKPACHLLRTAPFPMRHHLLRLHILEPSLDEILLDLLRRRPDRARDHGCFVTRMHFLAGFGPRVPDARVVRIGPGVQG